VGGAGAAWPDAPAPPDVLGLLETLVEKSLLLAAAPGEDGGRPEAVPEVRFRLLETVREYALERLEGSGEAAAAHRRHATHFLSLARRSVREMRGPLRARWLDRLEREHDNVRGRRCAGRWRTITRRPPCAWRLPRGPSGGGAGT
jgi:predicted ATPase